MKTISSLSLVLLLAFGCAFAVAGPKDASRKVAAAGCANAEIEKAAVAAAEKAFGGVCSAGKPSQGTNSTSGWTIGVVCHAHLPGSISVETLPHVMDFIAGPSCTNLVVTPETDSQD